MPKPACKSFALKSRNQLRKKFINWNPSCEDIFDKRSINSCSLPSSASVCRLDVEVRNFGANLADFLDSTPVLKVLEGSSIKLDKRSEDSI